MGLVGKEIVQSRVWIDPNAQKAPNLNYKHTYPITVFDAVKADMSDDSKTLKEILDSIYVELRNRQPTIPAKPANYLVSYGGSAGALGAIQISQSIPWNPEKQSDSKIPTEKAVGELLLKLGIVNDEGNVDTSGGVKVRWSDIIGRPNMYINMGQNEDGFMTQKAITDAIKYLQNQIDNNGDQLASDLANIKKQIIDHNNTMNPHNITLGMIGGVSNESFMSHLDSPNPHHISKVDVGLGNVDNTADIEKPISRATKEALDALQSLIYNISDDVGNIKFMVSLEYDKVTGKLTWNYNNGDKLNITLPCPHMVDDITYDQSTKELVVTDASGVENRISLEDLFIRYVGSIGTNITVSITGNNDTGRQIIEANINPRSITDNELADGAVISRILMDGAVSTSKIKDLNITAIKIANGAVTSEKIATLSIDNTKIADRVIDGRTLFSSDSDNRVLIVKSSGSDPEWGQIIEEMIANNAISTRHIINKSITYDKIDEKAIITSHINDQAITNEKLADNSITNDKIQTATIDGSKLVSDPTFSGIIKSTSRPEADSNTNEIPDTRWVRDNLAAAVLQNSNIGDRIIDGRTLFSSYTRNRVLIVGRSLSDPEWGQINTEMIADNVIETSHIKDKVVTTEKLADHSVTEDKLAFGSIKMDHIANGEISLDKLYPSNDDNMVIATVNAGESPKYTKVYSEMIGIDAIRTINVQDGSITPAKIAPSEENQRVLITNMAGTKPIWGQIVSNMIADRAIDGRALFTSPSNNMILAVTTGGVDPEWMKINSEMIANAQIVRRHMAENSVGMENLIDSSVTSTKLADGAVGTSAIADRSVTSHKLFTSEYPNRILGIGDKPFTDPIWMQINSGMIEDGSITKEKIFKSDNPYRVLGVTQSGVPPEYTMITHQFIVDGTIIPEKLQKDFTLFGTPELTVHPKYDADNFQLASTGWVRKTVMNMIGDFQTLYGTVTNDMIANNAITGNKLFTTDKGPRVLGVTAANEEVEFLLIEESLVADGAITTNKLQRDIHLLGSPVIEVRPAPNACDYEGGGSLIPDCQWVMERIKECLAGSITPGEGGSTGGGSSEGSNPGGEGSGSTENVSQAIISPMDKDLIESIINGEYDPEDGKDVIISSGGGSGGVGSAILLDGSVLSRHIQNRSIIAEKLFTSPVGNTVLSVIDPNSDPVYTKINQDMLEESRIIDAKRLFTNNIGNRVLAVIDPNSDPVYAKINHEMLEEDIIKNENISDRCITGNKIAFKSITSELIADDAVFSESNLQDKAVTGRKIDDNSVDSRIIKDHSVTSEKLAEDIILPAYTQVAAESELDHVSVRNTVISSNIPTGNSNGLIWFRI